MIPQRIAHVFPFDTRHLSDNQQTFPAMLLRRWPLAAVVRSQLAERSTAHILGREAQTDATTPLKLVVHRASLSGPRFRDWGDDWSWSLGVPLRRLGPNDVCVLHLNDYSAARYVHRAAHRTRIVLVFHGRGLGRADDHLLQADRHVVLHLAASVRLQELGVNPDRIVVMQPSIDTRVFAPRAARPEGLVLGFVGRLEGAKGVMEVPRVLAALPHVQAELIGPTTNEEAKALVDASQRAGVAGRLRLLGELPPERVAERMQRWSVLLLPSYSEGFPLVAVEAAAVGLPVAAVDSVLPEELTMQGGIHIGSRDDYADVVKRAIEADPPPFAGWVQSHAQAAKMWDALLEELPPFTSRPRIAVQRIDRVKRFRPLRRAVRRVRGNSNRHGQRN